MRNKSVAQKRFKNIARHKNKNSHLERYLRGNGNRLDVTLILANLVPTPRLARILIRRRVVFVNGKSCTNPAYRLQPGSVLYFDHLALTRDQEHFSPYI